MKHAANDYRSFILRIWLEGTGGKVWRYSLEDTKTGERRGFASLESLTDYLTELIGDDRGNYAIDESVYC